MVKQIKKIAKFCLVGSVAFCIDFGLYFTLTRSSLFLLIHYTFTSIITSSLAFLAGYFLNHYWTFNQSNNASFQGYLKYAIIYGAGIVWQNSLLVLFVEVFSMTDLLAKIIAIMVVGFCWNFLLVKTWVFRYNKISPIKDIGVS